MSVVFLFDIGNTNTKIGLARGRGPFVSYVLPTDPRQTADQFGLTLLELLRHARADADGVEACIASSVAPAMGATVRRACERFLGIRPLFVPEDMALPMENRYALPHEVGADRLVGAFAARRLFPQAETIVSVDFGTATTFDCVQGDAYLGGLICPGVFSSASALASNTAKLPRIHLEVEESFPVPGRSTSTSLNHGFVFGFAAMAEGLVKRLAASLAPGREANVMVVATGGFAPALAKVTDCFHAVRPDLLLEGLHLLYQEQAGRGATRSQTSRGVI